MRMKESALQDAIRLAVSQVNREVVLFRNNIGVAEMRGHKVRFGVGGPGGADLIGVYRGHFLAVEIKTETGRQSPEQKTFQQLVERSGGIYVILRSVDDAVSWVKSLEASHG